jgi:hypothetical protein
VKIVGLGLFHRRIALGSGQQIALWTGLFEGGQGPRPPDRQGDRDTGIHHRIAQRQNRQNGRNLDLFLGGTPDETSLRRITRLVGQIGPSGDTTLNTAQQRSTRRPVRKRQ